MPREASNPPAAASKSTSIYDSTSRNRANWNRIAPEREMAGHAIKLGVRGAT
jgi:hypothetical protein